MNTIPTDVNTNNHEGLSRDEAANAFLERWKDPKEVSEDDKGAKTKDDETIVEVEELEEAEDQDEVEADEDLSASETEETEDKPKAKTAADDAEVSYSVDGVEHKVSVKDLKRLAGQEAALTRKSQEVAAERKVVDDTKSLHRTALNALVQRAEARYKPFSQIDFLIASKEMSTEDFQAVRAEASAAYTDLQYLTQELGTVSQKQSQDQQEAYAASATECVRILSDPTTGIPGWDRKVYDEVRTYAKGLGMSANVVDNITDPAAIKIIHKAMAFDKIKQVATTKKVGSVKNPLKSTSNVLTSKTTPSAKTALAVLKATGSRASAADVLLARWKDAD